MIEAAKLCAWRPAARLWCSRYPAVSKSGRGRRSVHGSAARWGITQTTEQVVAVTATGA
ncbi:MAG TPA: hypothetical protein VFR17_09045 [Mycobacterium sp.]|nr:hypothetical protein [Mycobacterium sp.]